MSSFLFAWGNIAGTIDLWAFRSPDTVLAVRHFGEEVEAIAQEAVDDNLDAREFGYASQGRAQHFLLISYKIFAIH